MVAIVSFLITLLLSLLVTRVAAMALMLTGMSREAARFQARSAFTGTGFTSTESELIVNHPVRRRIIHSLMLVGNLGIAAVAATLVASLLSTTASGVWKANLLILLAGLIVLYVFSRSRMVSRHLNRLIAWALRRFSRLDARDYVAVLNLQDGYAVTEMLVNANDWLAGKSLVEARLPSEGVLVLGIRESDGRYIGAPTAATEMNVGSTLVLYGPISRLDELDQRKTGRRGEKARSKAVDEHVRTLQTSEASQIDTEDQASPSGP